MGFNRISAVYFHFFTAGAFAQLIVQIITSTEPLTLKSDGVQNRVFLRFAIIFRSASHLKKIEFFVQRTGGPVRFANLQEHRGCILIARTPDNFAH